MLALLNMYKENYLSSGVKVGIFGFIHNAALMAGGLILENRGTRDAQVRDSNEAVKSMEMNLWQDEHDEASFLYFILLQPDILDCIRDLMLHNM